MTGVGSGWGVASKTSRIASSKARTRAAAPPAAVASPISLRAYAKLRGVSPEAVSKAVSTGRLRDSVAIVDGQPKIADADMADREWGSNTLQRIDPGQAPARDPRDTQEYLANRTRREGAAARRETAQAELAELELGERKGELIAIEQARRDVMEKFTLVRTRLLGVPSRFAQRAPHLAAEAVPMMDELLREALDELSDGAADDGEDEVDL